MMELHPGERLVRPSDPMIQYTGRIDDTNPDAPVFHYAASSIRLRVRGERLRIFVHNIHHFYENRLGVIVNGAQRAILLPENEDAVIDLSAALTGGEDDVLLFKRQDSCHAFVLRGVALQGELLPPPQRPARRIEVYGDSVSAGEVSEAEHCCAQVDPPDHQGKYSNSYLSYAWQAARLLGAELHDVAQGGISLQDGTGYFNGPNYLGMLTCYDKVRYDPTFGPLTPWDFSRWTPHVVVLAIGQNDAHPENFMEADYEGEKARKWRSDYAHLIALLREKYPRAQIVLTTTILGHSPQWDQAIDEVCRCIRETDKRVHHFLYTNNGCGTPGHIRGSEAAVMARELADFIGTLPGVWDEE